MIKAGITGGESKVAGEIVRLLLNHPDVDLKWIQSERNAGSRVSDVHQGLIGECDMVVVSQPRWNEIDVLFNCCHTGTSRVFLDQAMAETEGIKIIDLSGDYRIASEGNEFVYGLPELNRKAMVRGAMKVANPGAFATAVELALLPLARNLLVNGDIHVAAVSGDPTLADNIRLYNAFTHSHVAEIRQTLSSLQSSFNSRVEMVPMLGSFSRGLIAAVYLDCALSIEEVRRLYEEYYSDHNFTFVADKQVDMKDVANTNKCILHLEKHGGRLLVTSVIDSMLKGSAGTAVHNMNLLFGLSERTGLALKPSAL
ncbi:MAG: N-acetyl-gamma-glutamyl-phosphate reductase [Muribaculaceae bacterium]|nr:N-acetyl-gamma-glutamyl-phosphate reductase [Muribaculaceae bacterium]